MTRWRIKYFCWLCALSPFGAKLFHMPKNRCSNRVTQQKARWECISSLAEWDASWRKSMLAFIWWHKNISVQNMRMQTWADWHKLPSTPELQSKNGENWWGTNQSSSIRFFLWSQRKEFSSTGQTCSHWVHACLIVFSFSIAVYHVEFLQRSMLSGLCSLFKKFEEGIATMTVRLHLGQSRF